MANSNRRTAAILITLIAASASAVILLVLTRKSPSPRQVSVPVDPNLGSEKAYEKATSNIGTIDEMILARQKFVDRYPRSRDTLVALNQLGGMYVQQGKYQQSLKVYQAAKKLMEDRVPQDVTFPAGILDVNIASTHFAAGDLAKAEAVLNEVIARPLPAQFDKDAYIPQVFVGPIKLAEVLQAQGRTGEAEALLKKSAERAFDLAKRYPKEPWITSYAANADFLRVTNRLAGNPENVEAAKAVADEFRAQLPGYTGVYDYNQMIEAITATSVALKSK